MRSERWEKLIQPVNPSVEPGSFSQRAREEAARDPSRIDRKLLMGLFLKADADGSGTLSRREFLELLKSLQLDEDDRALSKIIDECVDVDGDGSFGYREALPTLLQHLEKIAGTPCPLCVAIVKTAVRISATS